MTRKPRLHRCNALSQVNGTILLVRPVTGLGKTRPFFVGVGAADQSHSTTVQTFNTYIANVLT